MNVERAVEAVWLAHERGGRVLRREDAEALVRLVLIAAGVVEPNELRVSGPSGPSVTGGTT